MRDCGVDVELQRPERAYDRRSERMEYGDSR